MKKRYITASLTALLLINPSANAAETEAKPLILQLEDDSHQPVKQYPVTITEADGTVTKMKSLDDGLIIKKVSSEQLTIEINHEKIEIDTKHENIITINSENTSSQIKGADKTDNKNSNANTNPNKANDNKVSNETTTLLVLDETFEPAANHKIYLYKDGRMAGEFTADHKGRVELTDLEKNAKYTVSEYKNIEDDKRPMDIQKGDMKYYQAALTHRKSEVKTEEKSTSDEEINKEVKNESNNESKEVTTTEEQTTVVSTESPVADVPENMEVTEEADEPLLLKPITSKHFNIKDETRQRLNAYHPPKKYQSPGDRDRKENDEVTKHKTPSTVEKQQPVKKPSANPVKERKIGGLVSSYPVDPDDRYESTSDGTTGSSTSSNTTSPSDRVGPKSSSDTSAKSSITSKRQTNSNSNSTNNNSSSNASLPVTGEAMAKLLPMAGLLAALAGLALLFFTRKKKDTE